tara:strand:- start:3732 stop:5372 length:1641 start_codon:yes stop_codon:yes gene_type:complete
MGTILDQYGRPAERFARAVNRDTSRGLVFNRRDDSIRKLIPACDRRALAALSRKVVFNTYAAKACINQKSQLVIGESFMPRYHGEDASAGLRAMDWLEDVFFSEFDYIQSRKWRPFWETISKSIDRDGEAFILKTIRPGDGRHAITPIPAYRVRSDSPSYIMGGQNDGARLDDGIGYDASGRVVFYRVFSGDKDYEDIPVDRMVHIYDQDFTEQRRGYPAFSHALSDILSGLQSKELEILRQILVSNILLTNRGMRTPQSTDAGFEGAVNSSTGQEIVREQVAPGIYYLNSDQEIDVTTQKTPGKIWQDFQDALVKEAVVGAGWPASMVGMSPGQGTAVRGEIVRARLSVRHRFRTLSEAAIQVLTWGLADPRAPRVESMRWSVTRPARLTLDDGREERADLDKVLAGAMSEEEFQANRGKSLREHMTERARTIQTAEEVAASMSTPERPIRPEELLAGGSGGGGAGDGEAGPSQKENFDSYGVGVRAGALTPQEEDERHFREAAGLPEPGAAVNSLWGEQGGIRQPITLAPSAPDSPPPAEDLDE